MHRVLIAPNGKRITQLLGWVTPTLAHTVPLPAELNVDDGYVVLDVGGKAWSSVQCEWREAKPALRKPQPRCLPKPDLGPPGDPGPMFGSSK
jgi:hypothetical protein